MPAERVVIGPSPYPGAIGIEAIGNYNNMIGRSQPASADLPAPADLLVLDGSPLASPSVASIREIRIPDHRSGN